MVHLINIYTLIVRQRHVYIYANLLHPLRNNPIIVKINAEENTNIQINK